MYNIHIEIDVYIYISLSLSLSVSLSLSLSPPLSLCLSLSLSLSLCLSLVSWSPALSPPAPLTKLPNKAQVAARGYYIMLAPFHWGRRATKCTSLNLNLGAKQKP